MFNAPVDETPSTALTASVIDELRLAGAEPPLDEYAELPPAYNTFEDAYEHWCEIDKAKQAIKSFDQDPAVAAAEAELKEAKQVLKQLQATRSGIYSLNECNLRFIQYHLHDVARSFLKRHERSESHLYLTWASESQIERSLLT
jgi:hypothetical protein